MRSYTKRSGGIPDRATINQRRPMSPAMMELLRAMAKPGGACIGCDQGNSSRARALMDRGYAIPGDRPGGFWRATDAGHAALEALP